MLYSCCSLGAVYYLFTAYTERAFLQHSRLFKHPLSPASIEAIASQIKSPPSLEKLLEQVNSDFAVPLMVQCHKIADLDGIITPEEAQVIATIKRKLNRDLATVK
jgi:hypothetical protein